VAGLCRFEGGGQASAFGKQTFSENFKDRPAADGLQLLQYYQLFIER